MRAYLIENRYSHLQDLRTVLHNPSTFVVENPESDFARRVQQDLAEARRAHQNEEIGLALHLYQSLQALILKTIMVTLPVDVVTFPTWRPPINGALHAVLMENAAHTLINTAAPVPSMPAGVVAPEGLGEELQKVLEPFIHAGVQVGFPVVTEQIQRATALVEAGEFDEARKTFDIALDQIPEGEPQMRAAVIHDIALLEERAGRADAALRQMEQAQALFRQAESAEGQHAALIHAAGILNRQGRQEEATPLEAAAVEIARTHGLHDIQIQRPGRIVTTLEEASPIDGFRAELADGTGAATMISLTLATPFTAQPQFTLPIGDNGGIELVLDDISANTLQPLYAQMEVAENLDHLQIQAFPHTQLTAYVPYIYSFVLPMSIGDCQEAMGNHGAAEQSYLAALDYTFLNEFVETMKVWTRLADVYINWGDDLYRDARDDVAFFGPAKEKYENVIRSDGTIPSGSPLYNHPKMGTVRTRAQAVAASSAPQTIDENPVMSMLLLSAKARLGQIAAGLNYFGLAPGYVPPFSFEYLQNTARYFAQHAASLESQYIQFKSAAENEEFRREQMSQQVELAAASVELEQLGLAEAKAGREVAGASQEYAQTQLENAEEALDDFDDARAELLELAELEAWAGAAAVDEDDEVQQTITGYEYFSADSRDRSDVIADLARQRTALSHELEEERLEREVASAAAYAQVAATQVEQAEARIVVAEQRIVIAELQQRHAEENRDFLDMKEFSARMWYELAKTMRDLSRRYLDMAIEIAVLMERAYNLETGRNLTKIRFDYRNAATGDLLGSDTLLRDVDFFTFDYVTTTRSKKAPLKVTMSLADAFPTSFAQLKRTGSAFFETRLEDFDRAYPGLWLQKLHNVELQLVGLSSGGTVRGTLRNIGVSKFRAKDGTVSDQVYDADVMPLSDYEVRNDALVFRQEPNTLRLFENNGVATMWRLDLPLDANDFDPASILDVRLILAFDAFHDLQLENAIKAALPPGGAASRVTSMLLNAPDELFFLRNQGEGAIEFPAGDFPHFQTDLKRTAATVRLTGPPPLVSGLVIRLNAGGEQIQFTLGADGRLGSGSPESPLAALVGDPVIGTWTFRITAEDNPGKTDADGVLDLSRLTDVQVFQEYTFTYR